MGSCWCFLGLRRHPEALLAPSGRLCHSWAPVGLSPGPLLGPLRRTWAAPVGVWGTSGWFLDVSWAAPGPLLGYPGCPRNFSWVSFGGSRAAPGSQRRLFTSPCKTVVFQRFSMVFRSWEKPPGSFLGPSWPPLGPSWRLLGRPGWFWVALGPSSVAPGWLLGGGVAAQLRGPRDPVRVYCID